LKNLYEMFEGTGIESVPTNISYKSFKTYNLSMQNSYCDHRNFDSVYKAALTDMLSYTRNLRVRICQRMNLKHNC
jgi:hypothetical protein